MQHRKRYCDGWTRRDVVRVGTASALGLGLSLPELLARRAVAGPSGRDDVSLVIVFLKGGLSTIDTFDLKPQAPADIRGEFQPISTCLPGVQIGEDLPRVAQSLNHFSLIRSFTHRDSNHGPADHYMLTGYLPVAGFNPGLSPNNQRPSHGSVIARQLGPRGSTPPYVCLPKMHASCGAAYLGATAAPFVIDSDPNAPDFAVPDLVPPLALDAGRLAARQELLASVDRFRQAAEASANTHARSVNVFREKAVELMTSPAARRAFDVAAEPDRLRETYGRTTLGQSCLLARRLVEAGVRCVTIDHANWDTHDNNFNVLRKEMLPQLDLALSALFADLSDRGLLERTLVLVTGEFGRTPRVNKNAGRDHWGPCFTVALGGGGVVGGRVVGASDAWAEKPADNPYGPEDLAFTMHHLLGINPKHEFRTPEGRPVTIVNGGRLIRDLI